MNLYPNSRHLHYIAPVPVWYKILTSDDVGQDIKSFNDRIKEIAHEYYAKWQIEVPDEKHLCKSMLSKDAIKAFEQRRAFSQINQPAVGKWHVVPTNNFLSVDEPETRLLRSIVLNDYKNAVRDYQNTFDKTFFDYSIEQMNEEYKYQIDESWIQFYVNGDYKVLHNHLRYGFDPKYENIWAGGYYIEDGQPDPYQPYAGRFSFRVRDFNYYIKPEPGLLMMWPGDILHEVHPFYGEGERVVINFNLSMKLKAWQTNQ